ncbi:hypothetical protein [Kaistella sp.]|uniref:hypothetical protein n=1 Tax=Kaistella sp. TaxID=2782235 RepID=UPI002F9208DD
MENKKIIKIEFTDDDGSYFINTDNFRTETPEFSAFINHLAEEHFFNTVEETQHLSTLEKLEILCQEARGKLKEHVQYNDRYKKDVLITVNGKVGLDKANPKLFDEVWVLSNRFLLIVEDNLHGLMDFEQNEILPIEYDIIYIMDGKFLSAEKDGKTYIFTFSGENIFQEYDEVRENFNPFGTRATFYWARKGTNWALYDSALNQVIPCILNYDKCEVIHSMGYNDKNHIYIMVHKDGKCGMICNLLSYELIPLDSTIDNIVYKHKKFVVFRTDHTVEEY